MNVCYLNIYIYIYIIRYIIEPESMRDKASDIIRDTGCVPRSVNQIVSNLTRGKGWLTSLKGINPHQKIHRTLETVLCCKFITANGSAGKSNKYDQINNFYYDFGMTSFRKRCRNISTAKSKVICKESIPLVLNHPKHHVCAIHIFGNEKKFAKKPIFKLNSYQLIAKDSSCVPQRHFTVSAMVFGDVSSHGKVMTLTSLKWAWT